MTPTKDQALQPVWGITAHRQEIGQPALHSGRSAGKETRPPLPPHFRPDFHRRRNCPRNSAQKPEVSTALVDTAMPALSGVSCKCSPPCSALSYRREQGYKSKRGRRRSSSSSTTGAPISAQLSLAAKWLRRRRKEQASTRGAGGRRPRQVVGGLHRLVRFSPFLSGFSVCSKLPSALMP
jgi:hypothetical protein